MSDCGECNEHRINLGNPSTRCPACRKDAEIARLRAKVERLKVLADGCPDSQNEDTCGDCLNCLRFGMRAALDSRALALAEVERLTKERDEAAVYLRCAKCIRQGRTDATTHCVECSGDLIWKEPEHDLSDLVGCMPSFPIGSQEIGGYLRGTSTAEDAIQKTTLRTRAESAESRVAELEEAIGAWAQAHDGTNFSVQSETSAQLRALLFPKPASIPDLTFDADDPLPDMTPAPLPEPKCWHCSYNGAVVVKFCMRDGCPETPKFDIGGTVKFKGEERAEETLGASPSKPSEDGTEPVADTRRSLPEGSTPSLASSGLTPDRIHRMKLARDAFRAAMDKPAPCGTCGGSGNVDLSCKLAPLPPMGAAYIPKSDVWRWGCPDCRGEGEK